MLQYRQADRLVAGELLIVGPAVVGAYLFGFEPALRDEISVIVMLDAEAIALADRLGRPTLSLLRGEEPYKLRWRPRQSLNARLVLGRPGSLPGAAEPRYLRVRAAAVALARRRFPRLLELAFRLRQRPPDPDPATPGR